MVKRFRRGWILKDGVLIDAPRPPLKPYVLKKKEKSPPLLNGSPKKTLVIPKKVFEEVEPPFVPRKFIWRQCPQCEKLFKTPNAQPEIFCSVLCENKFTSEQRPKNII